MTGDRRAGYIAGLRQLADVLEQHDDLQLPMEGSQTFPVSFSFWDEDTARAAMAVVARALPCPLEKHATDKYLRLRGQLARLHVELIADRETVCVRRVVGTEVREVEEIVTPAVKRTVTKPVDVIEWDCSPILAPRPADGNGAAA